MDEPPPIDPAGPVMGPRPSKREGPSRRRVLGIGLAVVLFGLGVWVLWRELTTHPLHEVLSELAGIPARDLASALGITVATYLVLTTYDLMALRFIGHPLPYPKIGQASFVGYAFSHNMGLSIVSGGGVRWRIYSAWGLTGKEVAHVVTFTHLTFYVGLVTATGLILVLFPHPVPDWLPFPFDTFAPVGVALLLAIGLYLLWCTGGRGAWLLRRWDIPRPTLRFALLQMGLGSIEWVLTTSVLYVLLPPMEGLTLSAFLGVFIVAQIAGMVSQVPGGTGVFEAAMVLLLAPYLEAPRVLGPLIAYRVIYYLVPFLTAIGLLALHEISREDALRHKRGRS